MRKFLVLVLCLCLLAVCLGGCQSDNQNETAPRAQETDPQPTDTHATDPQPTETQSAPTQPSTTQPVTGTLLTEQLAVAGDYSRSHETSAGRVWEVENGFYYLSSQRVLHYADKTDLSNWVPVCSKPDCDHDPNKANATCGAITNQFMVIGDRIYRPGAGGDDIFTLPSTRGWEKHKRALP